MDESIVKEFEQQQIGKLKLSQAIRIGAKLRPQCFGQPFRNGGSCAIGAAYEAYTGKTSTGSIRVMGTVRRKSGVRDLFGIWMRNDVQGETREQIADWLESQGL